MIGWLVICVVVLAFVWRDNGRLRQELWRAREDLRETIPCDRCGSKGSVQTFVQGTGGLAPFDRGTPVSANKPKSLCPLCANALDTFLRELFMLDTEGRMRFGRHESIKEAETMAGPIAVPMMALLAVAARSMDSARRACPSDAMFEESRPWLESALKERGA